MAAPNFVELEITDTEPGFKGDTASNTYKPATLETGYTPVSYTHLDVYKRQIVESIASPTRFTCTRVHAAHRPTVWPPG